MCADGRPARPQGASHCAAAASSRVGVGPLRAALVVLLAAAGPLAAQQPQPAPVLPPLPAVPVLPDTPRPIEALPLPLERKGLPVFERPGATPLQNAAVQEIRITLDPRGVFADGVSRVRVQVELLDASGARLATPASVGVATSAGRVLPAGASVAGRDFTPADLDPTGAYLLNVPAGIATFELVVPAKPQLVRLRLNAGRAVAEGAIDVMPDERQMIAAGLIEGVIGLRNNALKDLQPARVDDGFERELRAWSRQFRDDKGTIGARTAFFVKGMIRGDTLLTMAYDSDKESTRHLLNDVVPDQLYPVFGDASTRIFDAQSASRLYVRLDRGRNFLLYGDFVTAPQFIPLTGGPVGSGPRPPAPLRVRDLGQYSRTMTGAQLHLEDAVGVLNAFVVHDNLRLAVEEFAANGTSGPFAVRNSNGVAGSAKVEILTRDRNNLSVILSTVGLVALIDYTFEPFSGRLLLNRPLASLDEQGNPRYLRVTYEVDQGGDYYWTYGVDGTWRAAPGLEIGGSYVDERNALAPYKLGSANLGWALSPTTRLVGEVARTEGTYNTTTANGVVTAALAGVTGDVAGNAGRLALEHDDGVNTVRAYAGKSDRDFNNPAASFNGGRSDAGVRATRQFDPATLAFAEGVRSEDTVAGGVRLGAQLGLAYRLTPALTIDAAVKYMDENGLPVSPLATLPANPSSAIGTSTSPLTPSGGFNGQGINPINPATGTSILAPQQSPASAGAGTPLSTTTVQLGAQYRPAPQWTLGASGEHSVAGDSAWRATGGAIYQLNDASRVYGQYEAQKGLASIYSLNPADRSNTFVAGVDSQLTSNLQVFSEYRLRDAVGDPVLSRDAALASGTRGTWLAAPGLRLLAGAEYLRLLTGTGQSAMALTSALDYTGSPLWRALGRLEWRRAFDAPSTPADDRQDSVLSTLVLARKLDADWTGLLRNYFLFTDFAAGGRRLQDRFQVGLAYRPVRINTVNLLGMVEHRFQRDTSALPSDVVGTEAAPSRSAAYVTSVVADWHPSRPWWFTGRVAAKTVSEQFEGVEVPRYSAWYLGGRAIHDINERFDVGLLAGALMSPTGAARQYAYGVEAGATVQANLRLSLGFNFSGFYDRDLSASDYTSRGVFLRLRLKFDEDTLRAAGQKMDGWVR